MANPSSKPEQEQEETFTCEICIEPVTLPNNKYNNKCVHPFCTECMNKYIQMKLDHNQSNIRCPATTCTNYLEILSCRPKITQQLFDKWCDTLCESNVLRVERVYCPNKECSELILNECGDRMLKRCVCPTCKKPFCYMCKVSWHDGFTCEEIERNMDENNVAFDVLYKKNKWTRCPGCGHGVERVVGCLHIQCRCGTMFCYTCGNERCSLWFHSDVVRFIFLCSFLVFIICVVSILLSTNDNRG